MVKISNGYKKAEKGLVKEKMIPVAVVVFTI